MRDARDRNRYCAVSLERPCRYLIPKCVVDAACGTVAPRCVCVDVRAGGSRCPAHVVWAALALVCACAANRGGRSKPINLYNHIHHICRSSRSGRTVTVVGFSRQIRLSGAETPMHQAIKIVSKASTAIYAPSTRTRTGVDSSTPATSRSLKNERPLRRRGSQSDACRSSSRFALGVAKARALLSSPPERFTPLRVHPALQRKMGERARGRRRRHFQDGGMAVDVTTSGQPESARRSRHC